jgi:peptidoglycan hydrolase-like protein with peptidoglycan-binding domain
MQATNTTHVELPSCRYFPVLKRNDAVTQNEDVRYLQRLLGANGYLVNTDGGFGPKTEQAVMNFQKSKGLKADGIVGVQTWKQFGVCTTIF